MRLREAAAGGDLEAVRRALDAGEAIDGRDGPRHPLMRQLVSEGDAATAAQAGVATGRTALHLAAANGHARVVELLAARGASLELADWFGDAPLHLTTSVDVASSLLERGASLELPGARKRTPLHAAVEKRAAPLVALLVDKLQAPRARERKDAAGLTPLMTAASLAWGEGVRLLLAAGHKADASSPKQGNALTLVCASRREVPHDSPAARAWTGVRITRIDPVRGTTLCTVPAAEDDVLAIVETLLALGVPKNLKGPAGAPLEAARTSGHTRVERLIRAAKGTKAERAP